MKLVELVNVSNSRISIAQIRGLNLDPGASTKVSPETVKHPAVKRYLDAGLLISKEGTDTKVEEPIAPAPPVVVPKSAPVVHIEPKAEEKPVITDVEKPASVDGKDLRKLYMTAPGVTEALVDELVTQFPTTIALAQASKTTLAKLGIARNSIADLKLWAQNQA